MNLETIQQSLNKKVKQLIALLYLCTLHIKIKEVRNKKKIKVLFVVSELSPWKTENLFFEMQKHPRFEPYLGVTTSPEDASYRKILEDYLLDKGIEWINVDGRIISQKIKPDIIFYQKPYYSAYFDDLKYDQHWNALFCYVGYAFNSMDVDFAVNNGLYNFTWQIYYENELAASTRRPLMKNKGRNLVITGMPIQDSLLKSKLVYSDPWKPCGHRKRIIYAPHHTIGNLHLDGINFSTFLDNAEAILSLVEKYKDSVQWAFKPHPLLYKNLLLIWGKERTDDYYEKWKTLSNTQFESGKYEALFKYSDAMIHDCGSFTIEYLYTHNPVLYLTKNEHHTDNLNDFAKKAFDLHYKASDKSGIEQFIQNVIAEKDPKKEVRNQFFKECLLPPNGKTACQNIINAILGIEEYK